MKLLLAEDELHMAKALTELLKQEKYETDHAAEGHSALDALKTGLYDAAILDVMMPGINGFEVARQARKAGIHTPILMLTARDQIDDKVEGLDAGADDYLTKPFSTKELLARVRALCRRNINSTDGTLSFGDIHLDSSLALLSCDNGASVRLSDKELRLMEYLMVNQHQVVTKENLATRIWGYEDEAEYNKVEVYISFTRKKLGFLGSTTEIKAVRGLGYELKDGSKR